MPCDSSFYKAVCQWFRGDVVFGVASGQGEPGHGDGPQCASGAGVVPEPESQGEEQVRS